MSYKEITRREMDELRSQILKEQDYRCAICKKNLRDEPKNQNVDHQHCFKHEALGDQGAGLVRGILCRNCNAMEGKIWNNTHRYGLVDPEDCVGSRIRWLESVIRYYNDNQIHKERVLHPKERRPERLSKSEYNRLIKHYKSLKASYKKDGTLKTPPKFTGRWSKRLEELKDSLEHAGSGRHTNKVKI